MTEIGDPLPNVTLKDSADQDVKLSELKPPFVLYYYPKADTPGCTNEGKDFTALKADFDKLGVSIYGLSKDTPAKLAKFAAKYDFKITLLSDEQSDATEQMGVWVEKNMYGKKYMGIERATFLIGTDGKVAQIWRKVKVKGHAAEVLSAAQAL
ncbi:peroxiredoxin [Sphingorhabdus arenilitoris]|uniref:thioredoxin-dependent peroxiredoxin n=1 Tax=Sphingorhabdus arenilitoris TaxID=1490041 RepID=A0ABV8RL21_9SPHN